MDNNNIDIEKGMNPIHSSINDNQRDKPKGILVNNHRESYENWFVDTVVRLGLLFFISIICVPLFTIGIFFSTRKYECTTNLISIRWLLLCSGIKNLICYIIIVTRLYAESSLTIVSECTINWLKRITKIHMLYEIIYNCFVVYAISGANLSNCDVAPFSYLIIYLVLNFFGIFLYLMSRIS